MTPLIMKGGRKVRETLHPMSSVFLMMPEEGKVRGLMWRAELKEHNSEN